MVGPTYELKSKVKIISDPQTFASGFTKREFVVTTAEDYPQDVKLECIKERCALLDGLAVGDSVSVNFNIRGNEYNERYFVNLQAWRLNKDDSEPAASAPQQTSSVAVEADLVDDVDIPDGADNIPF